MPVVRNLRAMSDRYFEAAIRNFNFSTPVAALWN